MKLFALCLSLFSLLACASTPLQDNTLSEKEKTEGWQLLFNGKDISQWRNFKKQTVNKKWKIVDGSMSLSARRGGDLITKKQYENFDFKLEWKISENGNSGVFILVDEKGKQIYSHAPEIQILDNEGHRDKKLPTHRSGSLYDMIEAPAASQKKAGQWNKLRILLNRRHLQIWQNNIQTVDIVIGSEKWNKVLAKSKFKNWQGFAKNSTGHLGLQDHGNVVFYKNLKIREIN
ncbi:MAG: DUF1080 domain-containing protein [Lentisphaeraceae bacterium]|nr:DUF1080 domain-containing protein [Lentisphaeraceae bacterium]